MAADASRGPTVRHRPRILTVFAAAFLGGAAAAVGVNRAIDVHLAQAKPQVECEPIFVALRSLPEGSPVTVWDVALRDWPKAMLPAAAVRATDAFAGWQLKYPLREGQPLLSSQLREPEPAAAGDTPTDAAAKGLVEAPFVPPVPAVQPANDTTAAPAIPAIPVAAAEPAIPATDPVASTAEPSQVGPGEPGKPEEPGESVASTDPVDPPVEPMVPADPVTQPVVPVDPPAETVASAEPVAQPAEPAAVVAEAVPDSPAEAAEEDVRPAVAGQPTLAAPRPEPTGPGAPASAAASSAVAGPLVPGDIDALLDVPPRPPVDIASLPSVMSRDHAAPAPVDPSGDATVRYLVVPERIARQADTSFTTTTPLPPASEPPPERPQPSAAPATPLPPVASRGGQVAKPDATPGTKQTRPAGRQAQKPPSREQVPPKAAPAPKSTAPKSAPAARPEPDQRARGGMFPNVTAGLEALGSWRARTREAVVPKRPASDGTQR